MPRPTTRASDPADGAPRRSRQARGDPPPPRAGGATARSRSTRTATREDSFANASRGGPTRSGSGSNGVRAGASDQPSHHLAAVVEELFSARGAAILERFKEALQSAGDRCQQEHRNEDLACLAESMRRLTEAERQRTKYLVRLKADADELAAAVRAAAAAAGSRTALSAGDGLALTDAGKTPFGLPGAAMGLGPAGNASVLASLGGAQRVTGRGRRRTLRD
eukprot:TRINITY_DN31012_c0_g1_i1.p1 TRINITY_DN31012_c0_g1~~TRINITY_DN31012_c0_g1_i1.p1  ORF type:complete len:222 (-),score=37.25 TRINITY_DN31012_c0_g1_i1:402-1067(-)